MKVETGVNLAEQMIQILYSAETQLIIALPRVAARAQSRELRESLELHLEQTRAHAERLERAAAELGVPCRGRRCFAMEGLLKDGEEMMGLGGDATLVDSAIISSCRAVEHYEIAAYEALMDASPELKVALEATLREENDALDSLSQFHKQLAGL